MRRSGRWGRVSVVLAVIAGLGCSSSPRVVTPGIRDRAHTLEESSHESALAGQLSRAIALEERAVDAYRSIDDVAAVAAALNRLGNLQQRSGQLAAAAASYREARARATEAGERVEEAAAENNLGTLAEARGDTALARERYERALAVAREAAGPGIEAAALNNLGLLALADGRLDQAEARFQAALAIDRDTEDRAGEATRLRNLGSVHYRRGAPSEALVSLQAAHAMDRAREDVPAIGLDLVAISEVRASSGTDGDLSRAVSERKRAQDIHRFLQDETAVRRDADRIAGWCRRLGSDSPAECRPGSQDVAPSATVQ